MLLTCLRFLVIRVPYNLFRGIVSAIKRRRELPSRTVRISDSYILTYDFTA